MNVVAFDTETALIRPGLLAPPMTCLTWARPGQEPGIVSVYDAKPRIRAWLIDPSTILTAHFAAFDSAVICAEFPDLIPLVFQAYREGRITCTKKRQQLLDIAGGVFRGRFGEKGKWIVHKYDLADLAKRHLGKVMIKDGWRLEYGAFRDIPIKDWPAHAVEVQARSRARLAEMNAHVASLADEDREAWIDEYEDERKGLEAIIADVPEGVVRYPLDDAEAELGVYLAQEKHAEYLKDQYRQAYADFVLYLSSGWGLRTYGAGVDALEAELAEAHAELREELQAIGMVRANGVRDMRVIKDAMIAACKELNLPIRRTDAHTKKDLQTGRTCAETVGDACDKHICLDSDACEAVVLAAGAGVETPFFDYAEFVTLTKMLSNDVKMLRSGTVYPVHTRYDLAETGRTTSSKPNIQNLNTGRVKNKQSTAQRLRKGVRQAFIPRPGKVFAQADFPQLELYTLAQCCYTRFGYSELGEMLKRGMDPHLAFAAQIVGIDYAEAKRRHKLPKDDPLFQQIDHARQIGKVFNFGSPGGMGAAKLRVWARKTYGVNLEEQQIKDYKQSWQSTFPEMRDHFAYIGAMYGEDTETIMIRSLFTERTRGGARFCASCNDGFQGLGADCAKAAACLIAEAEYVGIAPGLPPGVTSPLYEGRTVAFVHDEFIVEVDDGPRAHDAAFELGRLMVVGANQYLPDVPIPLDKMEPTLMRRWAKDAKQVFDANGRLVPWDVST